MIQSLLRDYAGSDGGELIYLNNKGIHEEHTYFIDSPAFTNSCLCAK